MSEQVFAQSHTVSGTVTDVDGGATLPGVNIVVQGTTTGTTTDIDGEYSLTVPSSDVTLVYSYIGYQQQVEQVAGRSTINISLVPQAIVGEELVVVGYGAVQRRDMTGSVASISARDIQEVPVTNVEQALQGRAAGVVALSSGDQRPGSGSTIRIRGRRSLTASNNPLYVVDGVPYDGDINHINTRDIQSIEVLKDAASTAIYGSRGANGVILVTTNRGGDFATTVNYAGSTGFSEAIGTPDFMNSEQYAHMKREANRTAGLWSSSADDASIFTSFELEALAEGYTNDFTSIVLDRGAMQNHQLSVQGGSANTQFSVSGNWFSEDGITGNQAFNRYSFRVNLDHSVSDNVRIGTSTMLTRQVQDYASNPYGGALNVNPMARPYNEDGTIALRPGADPLILSPLVNLIPGAYEDERISSRLFSNIYAEIDILDNLNYRVNFGPDLEYRRHGLFQSGLGGERTDRSRKQHRDQFRYTLENIVNYTESYNDIHDFNVTGLFSIQSSSREDTNIESRVLPYESQLFHNLGTGEDVNSYGSELREWGIMSFMGRVNYRLMDRYIFTAAGRWDGSSRLAEGNKWGFFPSLAFRWRMIDESFMQDQTFFSDFGLRVSYGVTGNTGINPYQTRGSLTRTTYSFADQGAFGFRPSDIANPDLRWETSAQVNIGLDMAFLDDRISATIEAYNTNTTDLLVERQLPITSGFGNVLENIGETRNRGLELTLTSRNIATNNFSWTSDVNLSRNWEEIVELYGDGNDDIGNEWFIGHPVTVYYDYEKIGIWQLDEQADAAALGYEPGEIKIRDQNGDGIINQDDRIILGSNQPTLMAGFNNRFYYRGFNLSVFLFGAVGHTIYNNFRVGNASLQGRYNNLNLDFWTPDNPTNNAPRADGTREYPQHRETLGYQKGDFLKVRNIQLGYDLPGSLIDNLGIRNMNVYMNVDTPFIFHGLEENLDPETDSGTISGNTPTRRMFSVGVDINF